MLQCTIYVHYELDPQSHRSWIGLLLMRDSSSHHCDVIAFALLGVVQSSLPGFLVKGRGVVR